MFEVSDPVLINGQPLAAGRYSLHTIPAKDGDWTIIFNSDAGQWGSFSYDEKKDVLRVKAKPQMVPENQEWLMYAFDPVTDNTAQVNIRWEKMSVPFTVEVKDVKALTVEKARASLAAAKPDDWQMRVQAANFALQNKTNTEEAMQWLDQSIKIKETFGNVGLKARVLAEQGKTAEAIAAGEKAIQLGKAANANAQALADMEKRVAEWKTKM
jgi:tetratricopeptide (TPR) repeat protein